MEGLEFENKGLVKLNELKKFKRIRPNPDVRGWKAYTIDKKDIGIIEDIIIDPDLKLARYLDIYLNRNIRINRSGRHLIIPINSAKLNVNEEAVYLTNIKAVISLEKFNYIDKKVKSQNKAISNNTIPDNTLNRGPVKKLSKHELFSESKFINTKEKKLRKLKELNSPEVLGNMPDMRGWYVTTSDCIKIGEVEEIMVDKTLNKVRYLDVKIDKGPIFNEGRHILVPIGLVEVDPDNAKNISIKININEFVNYPPYRNEDIPDYEDSLFDFLDPKVGN